MAKKWTKITTVLLLLAILGQFILGSQLAVEGSDDDDDDDDLSDVSIGMIVLISLLTLLLVALLIFVFWKLDKHREGGSGGKSTREYELEREDVSYRKGRDGFKDMDRDFSDKTRVEFPDTTLSMEQEHEYNESSGEKVSARAKMHSVMESTSSSFRDYRQNL